MGTVGTNLDSAQGHLGGYVPGGDEATYYPDLWNWFVQVCGVKSVLDIGCGDGVALEFFREVIRKNSDNYVHKDVVGVEGTAQKNLAIYQWDFTKGKWPVPFRSNSFNLGWCCEFVEHVEEKYVDNFLDAFTLCEKIAMTHAFPGQEGYHHVNCQTPKYWIDKMRGIGYTLDTDMTIESREYAAKNKSPWNHFSRSGLIFKRGA